jgi:gas vesicle protein
MVPGGGKILPQLQKLQQVAQQHGQEAEQIAKDTLSEIGQVLDRRSQQLQQVYEKGKKEGSS